MHELICSRNEACHGEHQADGMFRHRDGIRAGGVHHCNTLAGCRIKLNVVHTNARSANNTQLIGVGEQAAVDLHRRAYQQGICALEFLSSIAIELVSGDDNPSRLTQQIHRRRRHFLGHYDFHFMIPLQESDNPQTP